MSSLGGILELERAAFEAWQAEEIVALGPWRLRFMRGVTNRANSVWAGPGEPDGGFARAIDAAEAFYAARNLAPTFQITPSADARLDALLAERGYSSFDEVSMQTADASRVANGEARLGATAHCEDALSEPWFDLSGRRGRFRSEDVAVYRAFLERIAQRAGFAIASSAPNAEPGAVGLTILAPPLAGIFSMLTLPSHRRRGLAAAILRELARFAQTRGSRRLYLQVEVANTPAQALYTHAGFSEAYRYHYRRRT